jgi:hypothetical protein
MFAYAPAFTGGIFVAGHSRFEIGDNLETLGEADPSVADAGRYSEPVFAADALPDRSSIIADDLVDSLVHDLPKMILASPKRQLMVDFWSNHSEDLSAGSNTSGRTCQLKLYRSGNLFTPLALLSQALFVARSI